MPVSARRSSRAQTLAAPFRGDTEVLNIEIHARVPVQGKPGESLFIAKQTEMILFVRHNAVLGRLQPLFMLWKAGGVERHGRRESWIADGA